MKIDPNAYLTPTSNRFGQIDDVFMNFCFHHNLFPQLDDRDTDVRLIGFDNGTTIQVTEPEKTSPFKNKLYVVRKGENKGYTINTDRRHLYSDLEKILKQENELKTG